MSTGTDTGVRNQIRDAVDAMCGASARHRHSGPGLDRSLWDQLSRAGFTLLGVPEAAGGSGGELGDLAVALEVTARHAVRVPLAETAFLGAPLLARAGLPVPDAEPLAAVPRSLAVDPADGTVSGEATVAWARDAGHVVVPVVRGRESLVCSFPVGPSTGLRIERRSNLAGEPRDVVVLRRCRLPAATATVPGGLRPDEIRARGALARAVQLGGAGQAVLTMAVRHAAEREQFGRPLQRFQAVQQMLASLAAEVSRMRTAAGAAVVAADAVEVPADAALAVAAAKATTSAGAATVARLGHQIHGAIGFAEEHPLGAATTRLWAWRDEFGDEAYWQDVLADLVLPADGLWTAISS